MNTKSKQQVAERIAHLKAVLATREEEYEVFGRTGADAIQDIADTQELKELEKLLTEYV